VKRLIKGRGSSNIWQSLSSDASQIWEEREKLAVKHVAGEKNSLEGISGTGPKVAQIEKKRTEAEPNPVGSAGGEARP